MGKSLRSVWRVAAALLLLSCVGAGAEAQQRAQQQKKVKLLVRDATLFTMDASTLEPKHRGPFRGYLEVGEDGRIVAVAAGEPPAGVHAETVWDAQGHWIVPGFISAHSHLWQSAYRGLAADQTLLGWIAELYGRRVTHATAEDLYWFTLEGGLDHLRHGITAAYSFNYGGHEHTGAEADSEAFNEQEFRGESDAGLRFVHGYEPGKASASYSTAMADAQMQSFLDWVKAQHQTRLLSVMINGGTAFDGSAAQAPMEAELMQRFHLENESHYLEQPETQVYDRETVWPWFVQGGLVNDRMIFGHFIHTDAKIIEASGKAHAAMSWNPLSNGRLASGVADIPAYLKAGIRVGMGVDGEASADLADPFENMRTGLYAIRDKYEDAGVMSPYDVLRLHTMGSADVLGVADRLGSLEAGKLGDFIVIDPTNFGHVFDPYATLVFVTSQPDLERVYVGGELMVEHGRPLHQDLSHVEHEVNARVEARTK